MPDLKLASNWKSCGYHYDMRRWAHGNSRINFGFSKGDDNYGGVKRKELDDFCKSLGKQMNLVLYRMEDTENLRSRLRERRRTEERMKATEKEKREVFRYQQMERNKRRREAKEKEQSSLSSIREDEGEERERIREERRALRRAEAELEERRMKNKKWREEKSKAQLLDSTLDGGSSLFVNLRPLLICQNCQGVGEDGEVRQCEVERHNLCSACSNLTAEDSGEICPLCASPIRGRHSFLEKVLALVQHGPTAPEQETTSFTFTPSKKVEVVSPELAKRGSAKREKEEENEQKRRRGRREKVKEPSTVSVTLTSEGEEEWDEVKRIEEEIEPMV